VWAPEPVWTQWSKKKMAKKDLKKYAFDPSCFWPKRSECYSLFTYDNIYTSDVRKHNSRMYFTCNFYVITISDFFVRSAVYIRKPGISTNWDNFLDPFSGLLWGMILLAIAVISASLSASWYLVTRSSNLPLWYIIYESVFRIFGNFCNQGTFILLG